MANSQGPALIWGKLTLDPATTEVKYGDHIITLTPKEYSLLEIISAQPPAGF